MTDHEAPAPEDIKLFGQSMFTIPEEATFQFHDPREGGIFTAKGTPLLHNDGVSGLVNVIEKWIDDQVERRMAERDAEEAKSQCTSLKWVEFGDALVRCQQREHDSYTMHKHEHSGSDDTVVWVDSEEYGRVVRKS